MSDKPVYENHGSYDFSNNMSNRSSQNRTPRPAHPVNNLNRIPQNRGQNNSQSAHGQTKRPIRSAYPINGNSKQLRGVNNSRCAGKAYKDKKGNAKEWAKKTAIGFLAALSLATGIYFGINAINEHIEYTENRDKIVEAVVDNADGGYWEVVMSEDDFKEYLEKKVDDVANKEPKMKDFIREIDDIGEGAIPYMITGEIPRENISTEEILEALAEYRPYISKSVEKGEPIEDMSEIISVMSAMSEICITEENKADLVALFDAIIGQNSVNNSRVALEYEIDLNEEAKERVEHNTLGELEKKIYVNNNFLKLLDEAYSNERGEFFGTYRNFHGQRADFIEYALKSDNQALKRVLEKYESSPTIEQLNPYLSISGKDAMNMSEFATADEFNNYRNYRNDFYQMVLEAQNDPEKAISEWDIESSTYQNRIDNQNRVEEIDIVAYVNSFMEILQEQREKFANYEEVKAQYEQAKKELENVQEKMDHSGCNDWDR